MSRNKIYLELIYNLESMTTCQLIVKIIHDMICPLLLSSSSMLYYCGSII
jgi:hypothetical protein